MDAATAEHPMVAALMCAAFLVMGSSRAMEPDGQGGDGPSTSRLERSAEITTLDDAVAYALHHNSHVKAAQKRWQSALKAIPRTRSLPDPRLTYTYYIENVETRVGPQQQKLAIQQTFPWFGKRDLRGDIAAAEADAAWQRYEQAKLDVLYEVRHAYYDLYYLHRAVGIARDNLKLLDALENVVRARYKGGGPMLPLVQLQTELGKLDDRLKHLQSLRPAYVARLNAAMSRPSSQAVAWPEELHVPVVDLDTSRLKEQLARKSPALRKLVAAARKHGRTAELASKSRWPDVTLGVSYIDTGEALNSAMSESGKDPVMATVSINLPVWRSKYAAEEAEARLKQAAALEDQQNMNNILEARLETALFHYRDAGRKIGLYRDTLIPKAEQALSVAHKAFEAGDADFLSLIDAQRMLLEFELQYEKARMERASRLAEIETLVGAEINRKQKTHQQGDKRP